MYLGQIKIVDLRHSTIDSKKSKPAEGKYEFLDKQYIDYQVRGRRPPHYFLWVRYNPADGLRTVREYETSWGFTYVTADDPFWPEGLPLREGKYIFGDVVLMKCPLIIELKRREEARLQSEGQSMSSMKRFQQQAKESGVELSGADEDYIDKLANTMLEK